MAKGGARTRSGPPPDPTALRRERDAGEWTELPAAGRQGPTPEWPLATSNASERAMWSDLWTMPQAIMWQKQRQHAEVAIYVRRFLEATKRSSATNLSTLVRQLGDSLGLTTPGLRAHRWKIVDDVKPAKRTTSSSVRSRLRVVRDDES